MANQIKPVVVTKESLTATREARDIALDAQSVTRETLHGVRYGLDVFAEVLNVDRETLHGERYGLDVGADVLSVVREVLMSQAPFQAAVAWREVLTSQPNAPLYVSHMVRGVRQQIVTHRDPMPLPSTVHSMADVHSLRQLVVRKNVRPTPRSGIYAQTLSWSYTARRITLPANLVRSATRMSSLRQQVVLSRDQAYIPVSAVYTGGYVQQAALSRGVTPAPEMWSTLRAGGLAQLVVQSTRVVEVLTDVFVGQLVDLVVAQVERPAPHSPTDAQTLAQLVVMRHDVTPPGIDDRVGALVQQAVVERVPDESQIGEVNAQALAQLVVQERTVVAYASPAEVAGYAQLAVLHRLTYPPSTALGRQTASLAQQVVLDASSVKPHSLTRVASLRVQYVLFRKTPLPIDVIDPAIGRHVKQLRYLAVQHRVTIPPEHVEDPTHFVFSAAQTPVIRDVFPPPDYPPVETTPIIAYNVAQALALGDRGGWAPVSVVTAGSVAQAVALGDTEDWTDPFLPFSEAWVNAVAQAVALGDIFPAPDAGSLSDGMVMSLAEQLVVVDPFPDPAIPLSRVQANALVEQVAHGDPGWPDPTVPVSAVTVFRVAEQAVLGDAELPDPTVPVSAATVFMLARFAVINDPTLVGIAKRTGPRPVVSISIS